MAPTRGHGPSSLSPAIAKDQAHTCRQLSTLHGRLRLSPWLFVNPFNLVGIGGELYTIQVDSDATMRLYSISSPLRFDTSHSSTSVEHSYDPAPMDALSNDSPNL